MLPYFILFACPAFGALASQPFGALKRNEAFLWVTFGVCIALMIGFRFQVGADWGWLQFFFDRFSGISFGDAIRTTDPAYAALIWLFSDTDLNAWTVDLIGGALFTFCLLRFCWREPQPWLTLVVAIPYMVVVVAMGYDRQAVAIGFMLNGFVALRQQSLVRFLIWMAVAATFHISSIIIVPIGILGYKRLPMWQSILVLIGGVGAATFLVAEQVQTLADVYFSNQVDSSGALIRVGIAASSGVLFFLFRRRFVANPDELRLWGMMSAGAIVLVPLLFLSASSTVVDRIGLYFIPVELFVLGRLPTSLAKTSNDWQPLTFAVIAYSAAILIGWLNLATTAFAWIPYQVFPISALRGHFF